MQEINQDLHGYVKYMLGEVGKSQLKLFETTNTCRTTQHKKVS